MATIRARTNGCTVSRHRPLRHHHLRRRRGHHHPRCRRHHLRRHDRQRHCCRRCHRSCRLHHPHRGTRRTGLCGHCSLSACYSFLLSFCSTAATPASRETGPTRSSRETEPTLTCSSWCKPCASQTSMTPAPCLPVGPHPSLGRRRSRPARRPVLRETRLLGRRRCYGRFPARRGRPINYGAKRGAAQLIVAWHLRPPRCRQRRTWSRLAGSCWLADSQCHPPQLTMRRQRLHAALCLPRE